MDSIIVPKWEQSQPGEWDQAVADFLPKGSYLVEGCVTSIRDKEVCDNDSMLTIKGYVNFVDEIDGQGCESSHEGVFDSESYYTVVKNSTGPAWQRKILESGELSEWEDSLSGFLDELAMFTPFRINTVNINGGASVGLLCSVQLLPRFTNLEGNQLVYDRMRSKETLRAVSDAMVYTIVDSIDVQGAQKDRVLNKYSARNRNLNDYNPDNAEKLWFEDRPIYLNKNADKSFEIIQYTNDLDKMLILKFTPTDKQIIEKVQGVTSEQELADSISNFSKQGKSQEEIISILLD